MADSSRFSDVREMAESIEIARVCVVPPMKLQEIERRNVHPAKRRGDRSLDDLSGHRAGLGHPLRERLQPPERRLPAFGSQPSTKFADEVFGRAVVVGEIE